MKRLLISSIIFPILILTACVPEPIATVMLSETPSPIPTQTLAPTKTPEPLLSPEVQLKFDEAGVDINEISNAKLEQDGLHITLDTGEVVITKEQFETQLKLRKDKVLQIFDKNGKKVEFAFDTVDNIVIQKEDWVYYPEDKILVEEKLKRVQPQDLKEMFRKEKLLFKEYGDNVYKPDPDMINLKYGSFTADQYPEGKYPPQDPIGPRGAEILTLENLFIVEADKENGRPYPTIYFSETIAIGGGFDVMHFTMDISNNIVMLMVQDWVDKRYLLPVIGFKESDFKIASGIELITFTNAVNENNLISHKKDGAIIFVLGNELVRSFEQGKLSTILSETPMYGVQR